MINQSSFRKDIIIRSLIIEILTKDIKVNINTTNRDSKRDKGAVVNSNSKGEPLK